MAVSSAHGVVVSDRVAQSAGSVAGFTAEQVEEVRMVVRMFPIFLTTIFYWTIYSQVRLLVPPRLHLLAARSTPCCILGMHVCCELLTMLNWTLCSWNVPEPEGHQPTVPRRGRHCPRLRRACMELSAGRAVQAPGL